MSRVCSLLFIYLCIGNTEVLQRPKVISEDRRQHGGVPWTIVIPRDFKNLEIEASVDLHWVKKVQKIVVGRRFVNPFVAGLYF